MGEQNLLFPTQSKVALSSLAPVSDMTFFVEREREFLITLTNLVHKIVKFKGQIKEDMTTIIMMEVMEFLDETSEIR